VAWPHPFFIHYQTTDRKGHCFPYVHSLNLYMLHVANNKWVKSTTVQYKNSSVDETVNVNFYAVRPEGTRIH